MKHAVLFAAAMVLAGCAGGGPAAGEWVSLFDGETLDGWKASENAATFRVEDGLIVAHGPRSHLFYEGAVADHDFRDFELEVEVLTTPGSNSGVYFHTEYQDEGWPNRGYEAQVNNSHRDPRRTGSLYGIQDVEQVKASDNEWFRMKVTVRERRITIQIDDETVVDYTEPVSLERPENLSGRVLSSGTIALQGHDPESRVFYRAVRVRVLD